MDLAIQQNKSARILDKVDDAVSVVFLLVSTIPPAYWDIVLLINSKSGCGHLPTWRKNSMLLRAFAKRAPGPGFSRATHSYIGKIILDCYGSRAYVSDPVPVMVEILLICTQRVPERVCSGEVSAIVVRLVLTIINE